MVKVDIVVPIYYAPELSLRTIQSVVRNTDFSEFDLKLFAVDDTGNPEFSKLLERSLKELKISEKVELVIHKENQGFIEACYTGISQRQADYKLLLNSDTYVLPGWLSKMVAAAEGDDKIALVNPLTNKFPEIDVEMPRGANINTLHKFAQSLQVAEDDYLDVVTAGGFCLLIKDKYIQQYGFFDRIYGKGYCEEVDLQLRYQSQGLRAVMAPNAFVYHRGEGSFLDKNERFRKNIDIVMGRYQDLYDATYPVYKRKRALNHYREQLAEAKNLEIDVLIVSPSMDKKLGGVKVLDNICNSLNEAGISATITYVLGEEPQNLNQDQLYRPIKFSELAEYELQPKLILFSLNNNAYQVAQLARDLDAKYGKLPQVVQILQDVEGWFKHYDIEKFITYAKVADNHFAVSPFIAEALQVLDKSLQMEVIENGISLDFYGNKLKVGDKQTSMPTIATLLRQDQRRGRKVIESALELLDAKLQRQVKLLTFGDAKLDKQFKHIEVVHFGFAEESEVMNILANSDIFLEASFYQGFGLTALEAIMSGCYLISSNNRGAASVLQEFSDVISFFKIGDAAELAEKLQEQVAQKRTPEVAVESVLQMSSRLRAAEYARYFAKLLEQGSKRSKQEFYKDTTNALLAYVEHLSQNPHLVKQTEAPKDKLRYRFMDKLLATIEGNSLAYGAVRKAVQLGKKLRGR
jgi:GT2 family glycosyltransferase/glycosyltransferase involved in cell wall biosynthesis